MTKCMWAKCRTSRMTRKTVFCAKHWAQIKLAKRYASLERKELKGK